MPEAFHIQHVGGVFIVWDNKGQHYGSFKTRAEAQARIYELQRQVEPSS